MRIAPAGLIGSEKRASPTGVDLFAHSEDAPIGETVIDLDAEFRTLTKRFAADLVAVVKLAALEAVAEAIATVAPAVPPKTGGDEGAEAPDVPNTVEPPKTDASSAASDRILNFIRANPGLQSREIRESLSIAPMVLRDALDELLADGRVAKDGRGGGTTYRAV